jgi:Protein phosphatase 2C
MANNSFLAWQARAKSVRGASHERTGAPNQDFGKATIAKNGTALLLTVADGHGSPEHARSDRGSRFAAEVATKLLLGFVESNLSSEKELRFGAAELPKQIVEAWRTCVLEDLERDPQPASKEETGIADDWPELLYGSTLIAAAITHSYAMYLQIGDGDLITVGADGTPILRLPGSEDLPTNLTESLCQPDADQRFRTELEPFSTIAPPALVVLATDGYRNSFTNEQSFLKVGKDLHDYTRENGFEWLADQLEGWLKETTNSGSGDDITIALGWSGEVDAAPKPRRKRRRGRALALVLPSILLPIGWLIWAEAGDHWKTMVADWWGSLQGLLFSTFRKDQS